MGVEEGMRRGFFFRGGLAVWCLRNHGRGKKKNSRSHCVLVVELNLVQKEGGE